MSDEVVAAKLGDNEAANSRSYPLTRFKEIANVYS
jgi:hypothetical protein